MDLYDLCCDDIKKDYDFVKYIIMKYKNEIDFICKVADYYLENSCDELNRCELAIMMLTFTNKKDIKKYQEYKMILNTIYNNKRLEIEMGKITTNNDSIGLGFLVIFDSYSKSKIVLDFYAKMMIKSIFSDNNINLEKMLHQEFNSKEELNKVGINNYLINFISIYDSMLADYLSKNIKLLKFLSKKIEKIKDNWELYNLKIEKSKYDLMFIKVHEYMERIEADCMFDETSLIYYIGVKLGIIDKIIKYDIVNSHIANDIISSLDINFYEDVLKTSFIDRMLYNNVKQIISNIVLDNYSKCEDDSKGKILEFKKK